MHEDIFKAGLRRCQLVQTPVFGAGARHQRCGGVNVGGEADAETAIAVGIDGRYAGDAEQRFDGRWPVQAECDGTAALEFAQAGDAVKAGDEVALFPPVTGG
jgi:biotin carboxyl carrier protein